MEILKIGIIGLGRMGKIHLENLCTKTGGVEVIAVMNPSQKGLEIAKRYNIPLTTTDVDVIFNHPEIDAVIICSPTDTHADYVIKANNPLKTSTEFLDEAGTHLPRNLDFFMDRYLVSYQREMEAFINALKNKTPMPITGEDALQAMKVAIAANISVRENRPVKINNT